MSRYIDVDELKDYINGNEQFIDWQKKEIVECIDCCETIGWIPCSVRLPECEQEVWIQTKRGIRTTAMYEDGKMPEDESVWNWNDIDFDYDEKTDTYFIPEGWWEYRHFNPDDVYNCLVDEEVIAWMPLPEPYNENTTYGI